MSGEGTDPVVAQGESEESPSDSVVAAPEEQVPSEQLQAGDNVADERAAEAQAAAERLREKIVEQEGVLASSQEEHERRLEEFENKKLEFVSRARAHVEELQVRLQASEKQNQDLRGKFKEVQERYKKELTSARSDSQQMKGAEEQLREQLAEETQKLLDTQEESMKMKQEFEAKIAEVVRKAKEHMKQMQGRLEAAEADNQQLTEQLAEKDASLRSQNDKVQKYKQLMGQANARIEENDNRVRDLEEAVKKSQSQRVKLQQQMGSIEQQYLVAPRREEIEALGGIVLTVEEEGGEMWCLINQPPPDKSGASEEADGEDGDAIRSPAPSRGRWWPLSQLELDEPPVSVQRRFKTEASALKTQLLQFKEKAERAEEEFERYRQKAHAALKASASNSEEMHLRERKLEQFGEQLQAMATDLQKVQAEKSQVQETLTETKHKLQAETAQRSELEMTLEIHGKEAEQRLTKAVADCKNSYEAQLSDAQMRWSEKECEYRRDLDREKTLKDALDEEVEALRARLSRQPLPPALTQANVLDSAEETSKLDMEPTADIPHNSPFQGPPFLQKHEAPLDEAQRDGGQGEASKKDVLGNHQAPRSPRPADDAEDSESGPTTRPQLPPQAYSLHTSTAWQDLVNLRSQVRHLEISLDEEKHLHQRTLKQTEMLKIEVREMEMQQRLHKTVSQSTQMEYIRNVFRKFVESMPVAASEHEALVPVLMTFFQFPDDDIKAIQTKRNQVSSQKRGWFG